MSEHKGSVEKVCVVGLGYIGLPTAALLASKGYDVQGVDVVQSVVDTINKGEIHIVEPDLDTYVKEAVANNKLVCSISPSEADAYVIAVPTPFHEGYVPNTDYITSAAKSIAPFLKPGNLIILESTSPVGATAEMAQTLEAAGVDTSSLYISHCPERVLPGKIMIELVENDRIVGGLTPEATKVTAAFYRDFVNGEVLETTASTAEMAKLTENSFRDVNIAFANELSILCDTFGIDVWEMIKLANHHPRVNILNPGVGVGGHCIAVDPWFIIHKGQEDAKIIRAAREINTRKPNWVVDKIKAEVESYRERNGKDPVIACLGLAYKPDIDDLRESPALEIAIKINELYADTLIVEPNISSHPELELTEYKQAAETADIAVMLVPHKEFKDQAWKNMMDFCGATKN